MAVISPIPKIQLDITISELLCCGDGVEQRKEYSDFHEKEQVLLLHKFLRVD